MTDISINGIKVTAFSNSSAEDVATALWDAGTVDFIGTFASGDYTRRMVTAAAEIALWADACHDDDEEGTGEYQEELDDLRHGYTPDYEDALPAATLAELEDDVENFLRSAWPLLVADEISPEDAGHNFHLSRNGHGTGFWDRRGAHGNDLHEIAKAAGSFTLQVTGHGSGDECAVCGEDIWANGSSAETTIWIHTENVGRLANEPETSYDHTAVRNPIRVYGHSR